jgi:carbon storage regulator
MMLLLSRRLGERIVIDENIEIAVVQIRGNKVRLGVSAPSHVPIRRTEVLGHDQQATLAEPRHEALPGGSFS